MELLSDLGGSYVDDLGPDNGAGHDDHLLPVYKVDDFLKAADLVWRTVLTSKYSNEDAGIPAVLNLRHLVADECM